MAIRNRVKAGYVVGFYVPCVHLNDPQIDTIQDWLPRFKHAHFIDIAVRINGETVNIEGDWLKHLETISAGQETIAFAVRDAAATKAYHVGKHMGMTGKPMPPNPFDSFGKYTRDFLDGYSEGVELMHPDVCSRKK